MALENSFVIKASFVFTFKLLLVYLEVFARGHIHIVNKKWLKFVLKLILRPKYHTDIRGGDTTHTLEIT